MIRQQWRDTPALLDPQTAVALPSDIRLYMALARGKTARVSGTMGSTYVGGPNQVVNENGTVVCLNAIASVFFPPIAWQLVHRKGSQLLDRDRWVDVSDWCAIPPGRTQPLNQLVPDAPAVVHPRHRPGGDDHLVDVMNTDDTPIIECFDITDPHSIDGAALERRMKRAIMSIDELEQIAAKLGINPTLPGPHP